MQTGECAFHVYGFLCWLRQTNRIEYNNKVTHKAPKKWWKMTEHEKRFPSSPNIFYRTNTKYFSQYCRRESITVVCNLPFRRMCKYSGGISYFLSVVWPLFRVRRTGKTAKLSGDESRSLQGFEIRNCNFHNCIKNENMLMHLCDVKKY